MEEFQGFDVVEREELMVSPSGDGDPILRLAHFLQPTVTSIDGPVFEIPSRCFSSLPPSFKPKHWPLEVRYTGWRNPQREWKTWVDRMASLHESTWEKAGIREAIWSTTYKIERNNDLVLGLAERWCPDTKSFIFSWGEATITLEDMLVSGYSVLGCPVSVGLETEDLVDIEGKLNQARTELTRSASKKANHGAWMMKFMDGGSDIDHEAFLALWLSRFVFPGSYDVIVQAVFPIAIQLSRGTRVALAPAILASVYRDLGLLKEKIVALAGLENCRGGNDVLEVTVSSPFQLLQIWAWERFIEFRPITKVIRNGEPRCARWSQKMVRVGNVRMVLDAAGVSFDWRPHAKPLFNWKLPEFYAEKEMWVPVDSDLPEEFESFRVCLRTCELVGLDCAEQYLPHRVAMQFGLDQDLPTCVARGNDEIHHVARSCCSKPFTHAKLYIPPRLYEADVTARYSKWWKQSFLRLKQESEVVLPPTKTSTSFELAQRGSKAAKVSNTFGSKKTLKSGKRTNQGNSSSSFKMEPKRLIPTTERKSTKNCKVSSKRLVGMKEGDSTPFCSSSSLKCSEQSLRTSKRKRKDVDASASLGFLLKKAKTSKGKCKVQDISASAGLPLKELSPSLKVKELNGSPAPPGFVPKFNLVGTKGSVDEDNLTIAEILRSSNVQFMDGDKSPSQSENFSSSLVNNEAAKIIKPPMECVHCKSETVMEDVAESKPGNPERIQGSESGGTEVLEFQFEERVSRLEKIFAEALKAVRLQPLHCNEYTSVKHRK